MNAELDMTRGELVVEARRAIENAKRKNQRWLIWQLILDDWECRNSAEEENESTRKDKS